MESTEKIYFLKMRIFPNVLKEGSKNVSDECLFLKLTNTVYMHPLCYLLLVHLKD